MKRLILLSATILLLISSCGKIIQKQFYVLSFTPDMLVNRLNKNIYPYTVRLKPYAIEKAYGKPNIVYRTSPYELQYYGYRHWAVRPKDMITDLVYGHLNTINLVESVVKRLDQERKPDYEIAGTILAIEEYDSEDIWFAHLAIRTTIVRLEDGRLVYSKLFDQRKQVVNHEPEYVVRTLSELTDIYSSQLMNDLDSLLYNEVNRVEPKLIIGTDSSYQEPTDGE